LRHSTILESALLNAIKGKHFPQANRSVNTSRLVLSAQPWNPEALSLDIRFSKQHQKRREHFRDHKYEIVLYLMPSRAGCGRFSKRRTH
jgi:hypothetical protein